MCTLESYRRIPSPGPTPVELVVRSTLRGEARPVLLEDSLQRLEPYLPKDVLWRQKEQFSDGVGYSWIDGLKEHAARMVSDSDMESAAVRFPYNTPTTKEGCYFEPKP